MSCLCPCRADGTRERDRSAPPLQQPQQRPASASSRPTSSSQLRNPNNSSNSTIATTTTNTTAAATSSASQGTRSSKATGSQPSHLQHPDVPPQRPSSGKDISVGTKSAQNLNSTSASGKQLAVDMNGRPGSHSATASTSSATSTLSSSTSVSRSLEHKQGLLSNHAPLSSSAPTDPALSHAAPGPSGLRDSDAIASTSAAAAADHQIHSADTCPHIEALSYDAIAALCARTDFQNALQQRKLRCTGSGTRAGSCQVSLPALVMCLKCGYIGCGRYENRHCLEHFETCRVCVCVWGFVFHLILTCDNNADTSPRPWTCCQHELGHQDDLVLRM